MAHESTTAYLTIAAAQQSATHQPLRDATRALNAAVAHFQSGVAAQRGAFVAMQLDETDPVITGRFVGLVDLLKTCDRIANELNDRIPLLAPILARQEEMVVQLNADIVAVETP